MSEDSKDRALPGYGWSFVWLALAGVSLIFGGDPAHTMGAVLAALVLTARTEILRAIAKATGAA